MERVGFGTGFNRETEEKKEDDYEALSRISGPRIVSGLRFDSRNGLGLSPRSTLATMIEDEEQKEKEVKHLSILDRPLRPKDIANLLGLKSLEARVPLTFDFFKLAELSGLQSLTLVIECPQENWLKGKGTCRVNFSFFQWLFKLTSIQISITLPDEWQQFEGIFYDNFFGIVKSDTELVLLALTRHAKNFSVKVKEQDRKKRSSLILNAERNVDEAQEQKEKEVKHLSILDRPLKPEDVANVPGLKILHARALLTFISTIASFSDLEDLHLGIECPREKWSEKDDTCEVDLTPLEKITNLRSIVLYAILPDEKDAKEFGGVFYKGFFELVKQNKGLTSIYLAKYSKSFSGKLSQIVDWLYENRPSFLLTERSCKATEDTHHYPGKDQVNYPGKKTSS